MSEEAPWIVLCNGLFADLASWNPHMEVLKKKFNVLRYDTRGQGGSPSPGGIYTLAVHVEDLEQLVEEQKLSSFVILGISNGGRIALEFSKRNPKLVSTCIAGDTFAKASELLKLKVGSWLLANDIGGPTHRFDVSIPWIWGESIMEKAPELIEFYRGKAEERNSKVINSLISGSLVGEIDLTSIKVPVILFVGKEDVLTPLAQHQQMLSQLPNGHLVEIKGGHASLLEFPQELEIQILSFISKKDESYAMA